ncbi:hypothetical protein BOX15_Mlig018642g5 [Macrostomum lignano]|uniref:C2H2-type domain-containing protein n=1 Tax=Macrostomum lignano TaxID=282301 RepID=A0A267DWY7_9PLAT|nr:hypothetical protein BOX15_Mlig018642g5 [Macrostomum lignano]
MDSLHRCHMCEKTCDTAARLTEHFNDEHNISQSVPGKEMSARMVRKVPSKANLQDREGVGQASRTNVSANIEDADQPSADSTICLECNAFLREEQDAEQHFMRFHSELYAAFKEGFLGDSIAFTSLTKEKIADFYSKRCSRQCVHESPFSTPLDGRGGAAADLHHQPPIEDVFDDRLQIKQQLARVDRLFTRFRSRGKISKLKTQLANTAPFFINEDGVFEFNSNEDPLDINCSFCITHKTTIKGLAKHCVNHHAHGFADWKSGKYGQIQLRFVPPDSDVAVSVLQALDGAMLLKEIPRGVSSSSLSTEKQLRCFPQILAQRIDWNMSVKAEADKTHRVVPSSSLPCPICGKQISAEGITNHCSIYHLKEYNDWKEGKYGRVSIFSLNSVLSKSPSSVHQSFTKPKSFIRRESKKPVFVSTTGRKKEATRVPCPFCGERIFSKGMGKHCIYFHKKQYREWKAGKYGSVPLRFIPLQISFESAEADQHHEPSEVGRIIDAPASELTSSSVLMNRSMDATGTELQLAESHQKKFSFDGSVCYAASQKVLFDSAKSDSTELRKSFCVCHLCDGAFDTTAKLIEHFVIDHFDCDELRKLFIMRVVFHEQRSMNGSLEPSGAGFGICHYVCDMCHTHFMTWLSLGQHYRYHMLELSQNALSTFDNCAPGGYTETDVSKFSAFAHPRHKSIESDAAKSTSSSDSSHQIAHTDTQNFLLDVPRRISHAEGSYSLLNGSALVGESRANPVPASSKCNWKWNRPAVELNFRTSTVLSGLEQVLHSINKTRSMHNYQALIDATDLRNYEAPRDLNFPDPTKEWFPCCYCAMRFQDESVAKAHMLSCGHFFASKHQETTKSFLQDRDDFDNYERFKELNERREVVYRCKFCMSTFSNHPLIANHMKFCKTSSHAVSYNKCFMCGQHFNFKESLLVHISEFHATQSRHQSSRYAPVSDASAERQQKFQCGMCGKEFSSQANLLKHNVVHTSARVSCQNCGREFKMPCHLARHYCLADPAETRCHPTSAGDEQVAAMLLDDDEPLHECDFCNAVFSKPEDLRVHSIRCRQRGRETVGDRVNLVHTGLGLQAVAALKFCCDQCPMQFNTRNSLLLHQRAHTKLPCTHGTVTSSVGDGAGNR